MRKIIEEVTKKISAIFIVAIMLFTSFSPIIVYAVDTETETSGATADEASGAGNYILTADTMNVYYSGSIFYKFIFDGDTNTNTYCLRGGSNARQNQKYTKKTNLDNANKLDENNDGLGFKGDSTKSVEAIKWIVKNMYYYTSETTSSEKQIMKNNLLEIIKRYGGAYNDVTTINDLSDDLIHTAQQFVIWKYVNHNYDVNSYYSGGLDEKKLSNFTTTKDTSSKLTSNQIKEMMAIYTSLYTGSQKVYNGESNVYTMNETKQTLKVSRSGAEIILNNDHYLLGPITIESNAISKVTHVVTVNGKKITNYKFTDRNGAEKQIKSKEAFYIDITSAVGQNTTKIKANYKCSLDADPALELGDCYVYSGGSIWNQPILQVKKSIVTPQNTPANYSYTFQIKEIDLALTKQIIKVKRKTGSIVYNSEERLKEIDKAPLSNGETDATYIMNKTPIVVQPGDEITYKIRIFNEGNVDAIAKEVTDYLPDGLNSTNKSNGKVVITINGTSGVTIKAGESYDDITVTCTVAENVQLGTVLRNVAEISDYGYNYNGTYINSEKSDIDSTQGTITDNTVNITSGAKISKLDIRKESSLEDDDDFEQVKVGQFDLALRKFITKVESSGSTETYNEREPRITSVSAGKLTYETTAYYYHTKTPVVVKKGDIVTYKIRIYNEGEIDGYAKEITDYLPSGLKIVNDGKWNVTNNSDGTQTIKTTQLANTVIPASNGYQGYYDYVKTGSGDFYKEVQVKCEVTEDAIEQRTLTNVAEISDYGYRKNPSDSTSYVSAKESGVDRDSKANNVFNGTSGIGARIEDYYIERYEVYKGQNRTVYTGRQDDDDFETVVLKPFNIIINKKDRDNGSAIPDTEFYIVQEDTGRENIAWTDENGQIIQDEYIDANGTEYEYSVRETSSANEYTNTLEGIKIVFKVVVNDEGRVSLLTNIIDQDVRYKYYTLKYSDNGQTINNSYSKKAGDYELYNNISVQLEEEDGIPQVIINITNPKEHEYTFKMTKTDKNGNPLSGATIDNGAYTTTTGNSGYCIGVGKIKELNKEYTRYLSEYSSPNGYTNVFQNVYIEIKYKMNDEGNIVLSTFDDDNPIKGSYYRLVHRNDEKDPIKSYVKEDYADYSLYFQGYVKVEVDNTGEVPVINVTLKNPEIEGKYSLNIKKVDNNNKALSGVKFTVNGNKTRRNGY